MKTIEELIAIRDQYVSERIQGIDSTDFVATLQDNGFTLETFAYQEAEYFLKHFNPDTTDLSGITAQEAQVIDMQAVTEQRTVITYGSAPCKQVWYATEDSYNKVYCEQNGIEAVCMPYSGGVICSTPSDLEIFICAKYSPIMLYRVILV